MSKIEKDKNVNTENNNITVSEKPTGFNVILREIKKDKFAIISLIILGVLFLTIFIGAFLTNQEAVMKISLLDKYADILGQLIIGARNSIIIGVTVTVLTSGIGIVVGLVAGYYGGVIDDLIMRLIDFIMILPQLMLVIVFITIVPKYNIMTFVMIMTAFYWVGTARLIRSKALSESRRDYVHASKTMGTSDFKIIFREVLPNISSIIIVDSTLALAGNIGIETGLSFLGFGLPPSIPSLGTLVGYATDPEVLSSKLWIWLPASILILIMMLCINYVGQALKRAADARQRLG